MRAVNPSGHYRARSRKSYFVVIRPTNAQSGRCGAREEMKGAALRARLEGGYGGEIAFLSHEMTSRKFAVKHPR